MCHLKEMLAKYFRFRLSLKRLLAVVSLYVLLLWYVERHNHCDLNVISDGEHYSSETFTQKQLPLIAVLVLVCDRTSVMRTLDQILKYKTSDRFPVVLSMDCGKRHKKVDALVHKKYGKHITFLEHPHYAKVRADLVGIPMHMRGYYHISAHYGWALNTTFDMGYENLIVVEDDLDISPDFFEYFEATLPLMQSDPTIWCVSAYNDNGKPGVIDESAHELLYRSDFFPGLGWMLTKDLWNELRGKWPPAFWDDWMREPTQRKDRVCIRPEISRSKTFGKKGVSNGQFFDVHLGSIMLNRKFIHYHSIDLSYLVKLTYDGAFRERVQAAIPIRSLEDLAHQEISNVNNNFKISYSDSESFKLLAEKLNIMDDFKSGVPRGGYQGVVPVMYHGKRLFLVPDTFDTYSKK